MICFYRRQLAALTCSERHLATALPSAAAPGADIMAVMPDNKAGPQAQQRTPTQIYVGTRALTRCAASMAIHILS